MPMMGRSRSSASCSTRAGSAPWGSMAKRPGRRSGPVTAASTMATVELRRMRSQVRTLAGQTQALVSSAWSSGTPRDPAHPWLGLT
jgi:hypothetical protein